VRKGGGGGGGGWGWWRGGWGGGGGLVWGGGGVWVGGGEVGFGLVGGGVVGGFWGVCSLRCWGFLWGQGGEGGSVCVGLVFWFSPLVSCLPRHNQKK